MIKINKLVLYDTNDVAAMLGVTKQTIFNYFRQNRLKGTKIDGKRHVTQNELEAFLGGKID